MNCDHAFDEMTRTDLAPSPELEQHLRQCPRCREMSEILSPVLSGLKRENELLQQHVSGTSIAPAQKPVRSRVVSSDSLPHTPHFLSRSHQVGALWLKVAAVFFAGFGVVIGTLLVQAQFAARSSSPATLFPATAADCTWLNRDNVSDSTPRTITLTCIACHIPARELQSLRDEDAAIETRTTHRLDFLSHLVVRNERSDRNEAAASLVTEQQPRSFVTGGLAHRLRSSAPGLAQLGQHEVTHRHGSDCRTAGGDVASPMPGFEHAIDRGFNVAGFVFEFQGVA